MEPSVGLAALPGGSPCLIFSLSSGPQIRLASFRKERQFAQNLYGQYTYFSVVVQRFVLPDGTICGGGHFAPSDCEAWSCRWPHVSTSGLYRLRGSGDPRGTCL